jgi:hypothetical protein
MSFDPSALYRISSARPRLMDLVVGALRLAALAGPQARARRGHRRRSGAALDLHGRDACQQEIADNLSKRAHEELKRGSKRVAGRQETRQPGTQPDRASQ